VGSVIPLPTPPEDGSPSGHTMLPSRLVEAVFVGREREIHALLTCLEAAVAGQGRLVFLTGEAGIGKTRTALDSRPWPAPGGPTSSSVAGLRI
jgi:hypothetical protein